MTKRHQLFFTRRRLLQLLARTLIAAEPELRQQRCRHHYARRAEHDNHITQATGMVGIQLAGIKSNKNNLGSLGT